MLEDSDKLMEQLMEALRRDAKTILMESAARKLSPASARDLVAYLKFLVDEQERQASVDSEANKMSDEELRNHAKAILKGHPTTVS